ncbi:unnamed protein product [Rhodiola kirilowii]
MKEGGAESGGTILESISLMGGRRKWWASFQRDLLAGAVMGGMVHTIVAPIERAKLLLQTQESNQVIVGGGHRRFKGMCDCIARTVREEGILSLWRGNGSSVIRYYPSVALNFSLKDLYRNILRSGSDSENHLVPGAAANFIAGAAAGCTTLIIIYPLDIAHTRLAADLGRNDGMVVHRGLYFGGFDTMKEIMSEENKPEAALWKRWLVAQAVTTSAGLISYPLDTVRRRMMMQSGVDYPMYHNTLDCWKQIFRKEGVASFYRGALSNMFRSTGAAAILVLYDENCHSFEIKTYTSPMFTGFALPWAHQGSGNVSRPMCRPDNIEASIKEISKLELGTENR